MPENRSFLKNSLDCLLIIIPLIPILLIEAFRLPIPFKRGFFCNDQSLQYPYKKETYPTHSLIIIGFVVPVIISIVLEYKHLKSIKSKQIFKHISVFLFGLLSSFALVELLKFTAGVHRPNFIDYCKPVMSDKSTCKDAKNLGLFIEEYTCENEGAYIESRVSFPSAHSSISFYSMTYMALYIHSRVSWSGSILLKYSLEFICILYATSVSISRVSDYMHSGFDVIFGGFIGVIFALWMVFCATDLFCQKKADSDTIEMENQQYKERREDIEFN